MVFSGRVRVSLGGGRWLEVTGPFGKADLAHVADTLKISDEMSFPWLGQH
jgi:hypothetical protein